MEHILGQVRDDLSAEVTPPNRALVQEVSGLRNARDSLVGGGYPTFLAWYM